MKILYATSEAFPFAKSGGLGDVSGSLPKTLKKNNVDIRAIMPLYQDIPDQYKKDMQWVGSFTVPLNWREQTCEVYMLLHEGIWWYFIKNDHYFGRPGLYGYFDEAERFLFFSKAVLEFVPQYDFWPTIIHCHDWQTAAIPVLLNKHYKHHFKNLKTVLTIHNIKYQGIYGADTLFDILGLHPEDITSDLEYYGDVNLLKAGMYNADWVTTVSPTYAKELEHAYFAEGLDGVVRDIKPKMTGILNGIDYTVFNPETDSYIDYTYKEEPDKKRKNKLAFQKELGLPQSEKTVMIGMVTRLVELKGLDLVCRMIEEILEMDVQFVLLGTGEHGYEETFHSIETRFPEKASALIQFSQELASKIYAASDLFLMPSRIEPCGLSQIIALKYGALPVVHRTGGLNDTITHFDSETEEGNGFVFDHYNAHEMLEAIMYAVDLYQNEPEKIDRAIQNAFQSLFDWEKAACDYYHIYEKIDV
ncbi:starch synthase [Pelagirhabdus alkalitolerans]|uniref:Glycogen synthase n=1 Tax=Pelagirhabdus alkalitolerans TaxID=1612202 RepID=A0A1G6KC27_9BACI|nr:glycogen synthase GlgA [Pelagirhabdus alkalitolerans]SDC28125.1 starch synthase [Pelagirhabdus alkalitolerans]